jgi:uncharacterized protein (TIGR03435 family)
MRQGIAGFALMITAVAVHVYMPAFAQSPATGPSFEVVSIKRNTSVIGPGYRSNVVTWRPDGGLTMTNVTAASMIARAYPGTVPADIVGLPGWDRNERYDVSATSPLSRATSADQSAMLRAMLADRFKLALHIEQRQQPAYDLVLARTDRRLGPGLKPLDIDCARIVAERTAAAEAAQTTATPQAPPQAQDLSVPPPSCTLRTVAAMIRDRRGDQLGRLGDLLEGEATMNDLATSLRFSTGRLVVNKTVLAGSYRVTMNFDMMSALRGPALTATDGTPPSIFTAMPEQLGLKLEASHVEQETLVIDRLERPTEN